MFSLSLSQAEQYIGHQGQITMYTKKQNMKILNYERKDFHPLFYKFCQQHCFYHALYPGLNFFVTDALRIAGFIM